MARQNPLRTNSLRINPLRRSSARTNPLRRNEEDLQTVEGLFEQTQEVGLSEKAEKKIGDVGEDPKEIFSGGFISDVFDTLNSLQYGVVGLVKGKSFEEGVRTRQSFTDEDALGDKGIPGVAAGIVLDIAFDPLTYVPVVGLGKVAFKGLGAVGKTMTKMAKVAPGGEKMVDIVGKALVYRYGQDRVYKEMAERGIRNIAIGQRNALDLVRPLTKLDSETQKIIAEARKAGKLDELPPEFLTKAKPAFDELDRLGKKTVSLGLLKRETYDANVGKYIAQLYRKFEAPVVEGTARVKTAFDRKPLRMGTDRFKKRKDIPDDVREAYGEILEAGYPTAKSLLQLNQAVERAKFFRDVGSKFALKNRGEGLTQLPDVKTLGSIAGKYVPTPIYDDIQEIIRPVSKGILQKATAGFKFGKVILNPATHARNIMSNFILNNFEGLSPARLDIYAEAGKQLVKGGRFADEAKQVGLGLDTFASREIKDILLGPDAGISTGIRKVGDKIADLYQKEEEFAKLAQFIYQRKKGLDPEDAWKIAEKATFNYAQVTPFIRKMRESLFGFPFITFTYKATPQVVETLVKSPTKISNIGKIKNAIENLSPLEDREKERAVEPDYMKNGLFVRLPNKDKYGRPAYFDMTYIIPFGDVVTGDMFSANRPSDTVAQGVLQKMPALNMIMELGKNEDFFGNKIIKGDSVEPWEIGRDIMHYMAKFYLPPLTEGPVSNILDSERREEMGAKGFLPGRLGESLEFEETAQEQPLTIEKRTTRTVEQELLRMFAGLKQTPFNFERETQKRENELKTQLKSLLEDAGVIRTFEIPFIPQ